MACTQVTAALQRSQPPGPPNDFPRKCAGHCLRRLKQAVQPLAEEYAAREKPTVKTTHASRGRLGSNTIFCLLVFLAANACLLVVLCLNRSVLFFLRGRQVPLAFLNRAFTDLCAPVLEAVLDACGPRIEGPRTAGRRPDGPVDASALAQDFASAGNVRLLLKLHHLGYQLGGEDDAKGGELANRHAPHELVYPPCKPHRL